MLPVTSSLRSVPFGPFLHKWGAASAEAECLELRVVSYRVPVGLGQVVVDVPRTAPEVAFFQQAPLQKALERVLYIWGVR